MAFFRPDELNIYKENPVMEIFGRYFGLRPKPRIWESAPPRRCEAPEPREPRPTRIERIVNDER